MEDLIKPPLALQSSFCGQGDIGDTDRGPISNLSLARCQNYAEDSIGVHPINDIPDSNTVISVVSTW